MHIAANTVTRESTELVCWHLLNLPNHQVSARNCKTSTVAYHKLITDHEFSKQSHSLRSRA